MAPCQTQTGRHSQAPSEAVQEPGKRRRKIVAVGWNHSDKCDWWKSGKKKTFPRCQLMPTLCQLQYWKEAAAHYTALRRKIIPFQYGEEEHVEEEE